MSDSRTSMLVKVARMYHEQGLRQPEIAERLHVSQSRVSRLLKEAVSAGIVRTVVVTPAGSFADLEDEVRDRFGLADVVVVEPSSSDEGAILAALGSAGATYLESTLSSSERIGISSWSISLMAVVDAMSPKATRSARTVVQILGGVGHASAQVQATRLTDRLARVTGAEAMYFPVPGVVASRELRDALLRDPAVADVVAAWRELSVVLLGIGGMEPSSLLVSSGNALPEPILSDLADHGAVGNVCLNFLDADGAPLSSALRQRVLGIDADALRAVPRKIAVAGGERKVDAIRAAARGGWIDTLITDSFTARALLDAR